MKFKEWLILSEGIESPNSLQAALIVYKNAPDDESAKKNFYSEIINFVKMWYLKRKCASTGISLAELTSTIYAKFMDKIHDPEINFLASLRPETFRSYLATVVKNALVDMIRRKRRGASVSLEKQIDKNSKTLGATIPSKNASPEDEAISGENIAIVGDIISGLGKLDKEIFDLVFKQGLKYHEISEKIGIPIGTVKSRVSNLLKRVKKSLDEKNLTI